MNEFKKMLLKILDEHGHQGIALAMESLTDKFYDEKLKDNKNQDQNTFSFQHFLRVESASDVINLFFKNMKDFSDYGEDLNKDDILDHVIDYVLNEKRKGAILNWSDKIVFNIFDLYLKTEDPEGYNNIIEVFLEKLKYNTTEGDIQISSKETIDAIFSTDLDYFLKDNDKIMFEVLKNKINEKPLELLKTYEKNKERELTEYETISALYFVNKDFLTEEDKFFIQNQFFKTMENVFSKNEDNVFSKTKHKEQNLIKINDIINIEQVVFNQNKEHYLYKIIKEIKNLNKNYYQRLMNEFREKYSDTYVDETKLKNICITPKNVEKESLKTQNIKEKIDKKVQDFLEKQNKSLFFN